MHETPIGHRAHQEEGEEEVIDHFPFSPLHLSHFLVRLHVGPPRLLMMTRGRRTRTAAAGSLSISRK